MISGNGIVVAVNQLSWVDGRMYPITKLAAWLGDMGGRPVVFVEGEERGLDECVRSALMVDADAFDQLCREWLKMRGQEDEG